MSKRKLKIDDKQLEFNFVFPAKVDKFVSDKEAILEAMDQGSARTHVVENEFEISNLIAVGIKKAIDRSGLSREQIVDGINAYFGRTKEGAKADDPFCRNPLTIHTINNYLSKPGECPIPAYYLVAIHRVCKDLEPARAMLELEGAKVATGAEIRQMALGKLEDHLVEIRKLKKEIKDRR